MDLAHLGSWCRDAGLDLIQVLPLNDTGANASPYSAVSAFALHPVYIRLQDLPGAAHLADDIDAFRYGSLDRNRVNFNDVLSFKLEMLRRLFRINDETDPELPAWIDSNPWIRPYAVYKCLKQLNDERSWEEWSTGRDLTPSGIEATWHKLGTDALFHAWIQLHLDRQLREAAEELESQGVYLKGDIPILMSIDSADVWADRPYFNLDFRAGAPPDMFSTLGQMWGFPTYDWEALKMDGFDWWRSRLKQASRYYHAFRIDHVLGFFRIWSVPSTENTAVLGRYRPASPLSESEIETLSDPAEPAHHLTEAWTRREEAGQQLHEETQRIFDSYFDRFGDDHFRLRDIFASEVAIEHLDENASVKSFLLSCHRDRTFLTTDGGQFVPAWFWQDSSGYVRADEVRRTGIEALVEQYETQSKPVWLDTGRQLLQFVTEASDMLPCAEDLGVVPSGLPGVLSDLGILSLKIERWETDDEKRLADPSTFPYLSVSTPAAHDLSTLRQWWEEDDWDRQALASELGFDESPPWLTTALAEAVLRRSLRSNSAIRVFQIQDLFAVTLDLRTVRPEDERINTPGSVNEANWTYVLPIFLEDLPAHEITEILAALFDTDSDL